MEQSIADYNNTLPETDKAICDLLANTIDAILVEAERKIWHAHPVWFIDGNPIVGYSKLKGFVRLLFWSGQSFEDTKLQQEGKFKAAEAKYNSITDVDLDDVKHWLAQSREIQWDYKNIVKRKGQLVRLK